MAASETEGQLDSSHSPTQKVILKRPVNRRELTTREEIILLQSSKVNGSTFPQWVRIPKADEFLLSPTGEHFVDETEFPLSEAQSEVFRRWRRPGDSSDELRPPVAPPPTMHSERKSDFVQDLTTDCSVVASLCAIAIRAEKGHPKLIKYIFFPYNHEIEEPTLSANGKYVLKFYFNGAFRRVTIDDRLPESRPGSMLYVTDRKQPNLLWPALVEKAYLKVQGGYDFPGSNSGTDLWILTGWLPEQIFLQSDEILRNALWKRLFSAFHSGDALITMGTGKLTQEEEDGLGLVGEHDYVILDLKIFAGYQLFLVKNPWSRDIVWKGRIFNGINSVEELSTMKELHIEDNDHSSLEPTEPGTFWMNLGDILQHFKCIYLNWNPLLFRYCEEVHFTWDLSKYSNPQGSFFTNPQYRLQSKTRDTVWMLLSRHFSSTETNSSNQYSQGFLSLYVFDSNGDRVFLNEGEIEQSPYIDSPNSLLKLQLPKATSYTIVVSEQDLPRLDTAFTLSAYSFSRVSLSKPCNNYEHEFVQSGAWTRSTAGGNSSSHLYNTNPQFKIHFGQNSNAAFLLETSREGISVHVSLVWAHGQRIQNIKSRDVVCHSGEYRRGSALAKTTDILAGSYTIVCSTFERGQLGEFNLRVNSSTECTVSKIPVEGAGRFITKTPPLKFSSEVRCMVASLKTSRLNRLRVVAKSGAVPADGPSSPLRLAVDYGKGEIKETLTVTGATHVQ